MEPTTMLAYRHVPDSQDVVEQRIPIPVPQPGEVLLRVAAAGLCHSDLHVLHGGFRGSGPIGDETYTLGHETCGIAVSSHPSVTTIEKDALYVVVGTNPCGTCASCLAGRDNICVGGKQMIGLGRDGGFAEYLAVPATSLVKVPEGVSASQASACTDALVTPYHGIKTIAKLQPHENVVVIGLGGVGMNALRCAKLFGNQVFASDIKPEALESALTAGATAALVSADLATLLAQPSAPVITLVVDCVGVPSTFSFAQQLVGPGGRVLLLGLAAPSLQWDVGANLQREVALLMSFWGTRNELVEVLDLVREGKLNPEVEVRPMSELGDSVQAMSDGKVLGRRAFEPVKEKVAVGLL